MPVIHRLTKEYKLLLTDLHDVVCEFDKKINEKEKVGEIGKQDKYLGLNRFNYFDNKFKNSLRVFIKFINLRADNNYNGFYRKYGDFIRLTHQEIDIYELYIKPVLHYYAKDKKRKKIRFTESTAIFYIVVLYVTILNDQVSKNYKNNISNTDFQVFNMIDKVNKYLGEPFFNELKNLVIAIRVDYLKKKEKDSINRPDSKRAVNSAKKKYDKIRKQLDEDLDKGVRTTIPFLLTLFTKATMAEPLHNGWSYSSKKDELVKKVEKLLRYIDDLDYDDSNELFKELQNLIDAALVKCNRILGKRKKLSEGR